MAKPTIPPAIADVLSKVKPRNVPPAVLTIPRRKLFGVWGF